MTDATFYAEVGMEDVPINCDGCVKLKTDAGFWVELQFRRSDGEISINCSGPAIIKLVASNVIRIGEDK